MRTCMWLAVCLALLSAPSPVRAASFDCAGAGTAHGQPICLDPTLFGDDGRVVTASPDAARQSRLAQGDLGGADRLGRGGPQQNGGMTSSPAALQAFAPDLARLAGRWTDGQCARRFNDWMVSGLDIIFHDQSGGVDVERVVGLQPGAFVTQSVSGAGPTGGLWRYQPVSANLLRVQNLSTGVAFSLRRCL